MYHCKTHGTIEIQSVKLPNDGYGEFVTLACKAEKKKKKSKRNKTTALRDKGGPSESFPFHLSRTLNHYIQETEETAAT